MQPSDVATLQEAMQLHQSGKFPDAERLYRKLLKRNPNSFEPHFLMAALKMQSGKPDESVRYWDGAIAAQPANLEAQYNRAVALDQTGQPAEALAGYDRVVAMQPAHAESWFNRGNVLSRLLRYDEAVASYDRMLALAPNTPDAHNNRGSALATLGRHPEALASFEQTLRLRPDYPLALNNQATSLKALGRLAEALAICDRVIAAHPDTTPVRVTRGSVYQALGRNAEALADYDIALKASPNDVELINHRIKILVELNRAAEALTEAERAIVLNPGEAGSYVNRGNALQSLGREEQALADYAKAITLRPTDAMAHYNFGTALQALERHEDAIPHFARAATLAPDYAEAKWNGSASYLALGRFAEGWQLYEHRWARQIRGTAPRDYTQPRWDGGRVPGTLLVWGEQGPGEHLLHASLLPALRSYADKIVLEVDPRLQRLFARSFPDFEVIPYASALYSGPIDAHEPIASLAKHLLTSWDSFPGHQRGYLEPDAALTRRLREQLNADGRQVIGLTWISRNSKIGKFKSALLKDFEPLLRLPGYRFVDLQYGDTAAEREAVERELGVKIEHLDEIDNMNDLDGLAALISACDAVLTVSSTTAHLAGAVGVPTWVMVPFGRGHLWYWFDQRPDSPWYPRVKVRRQAKGQSWAELIAGLVPQVSAAVDATIPANR
jgi:tetratricopeptide (TPR) repeat protein